MSESCNSVDSWLHEVAERMRNEQSAGAAPRAEKLTVRQFLEKFDRARRGYRVVRSVRRKLEQHNLRTSPDFEFAYIDNPISVQLDDDGVAQESETNSGSTTMHVDSLTAAHNNPVCVKPDDTVIRAITVMRMECFSQLPVMTTKHVVKGVISWRSIGKVYADGRNPERVRECMEEPQEIRTKTTLADAVDAIWKHDYVIVRGEDNAIAGIVTAADLADQFRQLSHPFLLIGEIEHHLRNFIRGRFTIEEFTKAAKAEQEVRGPDDLTFGGYCRLLEREGSWEKLDLRIDCKEFIKCLERVRSIRNDIMHFSPDGIEPDDLEQLERLARLLRELALTRESA